LDTFDREIVTITFQAADGGPTVIYRQFIASVEYYLGEMLYVHDDEKGWQTLQEMINTNKRVVVYSSWDKINDPSTLAWLRLDPNKLIYGTWSYSDTINHSGQLRDTMLSFYKTPQPPEVTSEWQTLDYAVPTSWPAIKTDLEHLKKPEICLNTFAKDEDRWMFKVVKVCVPRMKFVHRVSVDYYFRSPVFKVVDWINEQNLKKAKSAKKARKVGK